MRLKLSTHSYTQLNEDIDDEQNTIPVKSALGFPNIDPLNHEYFYLDIFDSQDNYETVKVINIIGNYLLCVRGQGGTSNKPFISGSHCGLRINKAVIDELITRTETYVHTQIAPKLVWTVTHNLDKYPSVRVVDSAESIVHADVQYIDRDNLVITFNFEFSGKAYLN